MRLAPLFIVFCCCAFLLLSCGKKKTDWSVNMDKQRKSPYGTYLARHSIPLFFKGLPVEDLPRNYKFGKLSSLGSAKGRSLVVMSGIYLQITESEWEEMTQFASKGNEIVLFCENYNDPIASFIKRQVHAVQPIWSPANGDSNGTFQSVILANDTLKKYSYIGEPISNYFEPYTAPEVDTSSLDQTDTTIGSLNVSPTDTAISTTNRDADNADSEYDSIYDGKPDTTVRDSVLYFYVDTLGYGAYGPNMLRITLGDGHITINTAPCTISNYFLLQAGNEQYLAGIWNSLPHDIGKVYWHDFFFRTIHETSLSDLFKASGLADAALLILIGTLLYVLFQKRRQRIIPIIDPLKNESVTFVETVGRLYYNKGNNLNIAEKIIQQFLEWVRATYYLPTTAINPEFARQLSHKSGMPKEQCDSIVSMIAHIRTTATNPEEAYIYGLYSLTQQFYKNKK